MASLTQSWNGWDYYSDGTVIDNATGAYYFQGDKVWSPDMPVAQGGASWSDGWGSTLQALAGTAVNTWSARTLMQQNQQGQRYIEGQRYMLPSGGANSGGGSTLLLLGLGVLLYALTK